MRKLKAISEKGFTLIEVLLVIIVIGIMAAIAFKSMDVALDNSRWDATTQEMEKLSWGIAGNPELFANGIRSDFGYVGDVGSLPPNLDALAANPGGYATWKGPYIQNDFTQNPNDYKTDGWGNLYTYTGGVTIASGGSGGNPITKPFANAAADLTSNTVQGVVTDGQGNSPGSSASNVSIRIVYPNGSGGRTTATANPSASGNYSFVGLIPQGLRMLTAIYTPTNDTLVRTAVVLPRSTTIVDFKYSGNLWGSGGSGGSLSYVSGSAATQNSGKDVTFQVRNVGSANVTISSLSATFVHVPVSYYEQVIWGGTTVANQSSPRFASGQTANFSASQVVSTGATVTVNLNNFKICPSGGCANGNMTGTAFTITFSDGSVLTFSV
ncbi:MAG: prepilin-type N-terminal cleavage/methylation domain-containing protein [candidate division Zixibacteria bacterium]|nr:prepilin-type N-terminal cleavage/methylation domain-containing protein [candidate division Zixibacteria bacterium]